MAESIDPVTESSTEPEKGGATKATRGRPPAEFYMQEYGQSYRPQVDDNYYQHRCLMLERELSDVQNKNHQLSDELFKTRKELSEDRTELLIKHQNEVAQLKEDFRERLDSHKEVQHKRERDLVKEIDSLEKELYKKEIEYKNGELSLKGVVKDFADALVPMIVGNNRPDLTGLIQKQIPETAQQNPNASQITQEKTVQSNTSFEHHPESTLRKEPDEELSTLLEKELNKQSVEEEV
jgi:hypothetical protein